MTKRWFLNLLLVQLATVIFHFGGAAEFAHAESQEFLSQKIKIESLIESHIRGIIGEQLAGGEYFVHCSIVSPAPRTSANKKSEAVALPYTPVKVKPGVLQELFDSKNVGVNIDDLDLRVNLVFDERIPPEKRKLLEDVVRERFGFDGQKKILNVSSMVLVQSPLSVEKNLALEKERLANQALLLGVEAERSKLEMTKREMELERKLAEVQAKIASEALKKPEATPPAPLPAPTAASPAGQSTTNAQGNVVQPKTALDHLREFQVLLVALFLGVFGLIFVVIGDRSFKKGLGPVASAFEAIGGAIANLKLSGSGGSASSQSSAREADGHATPTSPLVAGQVPVSHGDNDDAEEVREFLKMVEEKIMVLMKEGSFNFYRHLIDMIDGEATLPLGAAIFATLNSDMARQLTTALSIDHIDKIRRFMAGPGGLSRAKELRKQALSEFYGRISMDEFSSSAISELKNLEWLTRMTTSQMKEFILPLKEEQRTAVLACLPPTRISMILAETQGTQDRQKMLKSLQGLDKISNTQLVEIMNDVGKSAKPSTSSESQKPVDSAKVLAAVIETLPAADQDELIEKVGQNKSLASKMREYFVPFSAVLKLPKELILEIFVERSDQQIAQILFAAGEDIRKAVIGTMPEIRAASIDDELRVLDSKQFYKTRNTAISLRLQKEISGFLLKLAKEGLLDASTDAALKVVGDVNNGAA